jgi:NAD(P)H-dependent FMN reductase
MSERRVLLISGSLRSQSTNAAVLRTAVAVAPPPVVPTVFEGLAGLPNFNPEDDGPRLPDEVRELRAAIHEADAVLFSTPEYAGGLPGSFKNLLDWTIGDAEARAIYEKPVAWINASTRGAANAHQALRRVLGYAHATVVEPACVDAPVTSSLIDADGLIADHATRERIRRSLAALVEHLDGPARDPASVPIAEIPVACALPDDAARSQLDEWRRLTDSPSVTVERVSPTELAIHLGSDADVPFVVDLAQREKACCPFFEFSLDIGAESLCLRLRVPDDAAQVLDGLLAGRA